MIEKSFFEVLNDARRRADQAIASAFSEVYEIYMTQIVYKVTDSISPVTENTADKNVCINEESEE